jgi:uncharacterized protein (DUF4415 family)
MKKLTTEQRRDIAVLAEKEDGGIDFFAIPEMRNGNGAGSGMAFRPIKRPVTIRLDEDVLDWLKGYGPGYQTRANLLLRHAMMNDARGQRQS